MRPVPPAGTQTCSRRSTDVFGGMAMFHRPRFEVTATGRVSSGSGEATAMVTKRRSAVFWPGSGKTVMVAG